MPIKNYTTKISAHKTIGEITGILAEHGARRIAQDYDNGKVIAVCFEIDTPFGIHAVRLPANADKVLLVLQKQRVSGANYAQAEMTAWRIVKDWIDAQMAILESEMVTMSEIFFPYMLNNPATGETVYQLFVNKQLRLGDGTNG